MLERISLFQPAASFTLLENMIIWCNIQLTINPLYRKPIENMIIWCNIQVIINPLYRKPIRNMIILCYIQIIINPLYRKPIRNMIIWCNIQVIINPLYIEPSIQIMQKPLKKINNNSNMRKLLSNKNFTCSFFIQFFFIQTYKNIKDDGREGTLGCFLHQSQSFIITFSYSLA